MKWHRLSILVLCATFGIWQSAFAAMVSPSLAKTKAEAETKGYVFLTDHDEIISAARKEGKLRVVSGLSPESLKTMLSAFRKKYPFIDISAHETTGSDDHQRILLELKAGMNKEWDAISMANDFYNEYGPYQKKFDILGMSQNGVVQIHAQHDRSTQPQCRISHRHDPDRGNLQQEFDRA